KVRIGGGVKFRNGEGRSLVIGPPASPNFPWVLLDSMLLRYREIISRAHGRRDVAPLEGGDHESLVRQFPSDRRSLLQKWFNSCLKEKPDRGKEAEVFTALLCALEEAEESD
ncbi:MAG: hypothetical protein ACQKBU_08345, partial [Verrucomicrobiales bacterium]